MGARSHSSSDLQRRFLYALLAGVASGIGDALVGQSGLGEIRLSRSVLLGLIVSVGVWIAWTTIAKVAADRRRRARGAGMYGRRSETMEAHPVGEFPHAGVVWKVVEWIHGIDAPFQRGIRLEGLEVQTPPRCPVCGTELNQSQRFWGSWDWTCPAGDFAVRQPQDYELVARDVLKLVRRDIERLHAEKGKR